MEPMADTVKEDAAIINAFFLPIRSVIVPEMTQPAMVPSKADETTQPSMAGVN